MQSKTVHWVSLFTDRKQRFTLIFFGIKYIPQETLNKMKDKSIIQNIFRIQSDDSSIYGFCCIAFIEYMIAGNLFSPDNYQKNDKKINKYFKDKYGKRKPKPCFTLKLSSERNKT